MSRSRGGGRRSARRAGPAGISNAQARELGRLSRLLGLPYVGQGLDGTEASQLITRLRTELAQRNARPKLP